MTPTRRATPRHRLPVAVLLVVPLASLACGGSPGPEQAAPVPAPPPSSAASPTAALEAVYRARTDSALRQHTEADVRFMTGMIGHHAQALLMAGWIPTHGASPALRRLGARIINAQTDEIATMQRWLQDRGRPVPQVHATATDVQVEGPDYIMHMPGMLTDAQLQELDAARGEAFDRLFLRYMIQHHRGAVTMVHKLFATDGAAQDGLVFKLASDIQVDQTTEIARMEGMLESLSARDRDS